MSLSAIEARLSALLNLTAIRPLWSMSVPMPRPLARTIAVPARRTELTKPIVEDGYGACSCDNSSAGNRGYEVDNLA